MNKLYSIISRSINLIVLLAAGLACHTSYAASSDFSETFQGNLSSRNKSWITHSFELPAPGSIDITLDWGRSFADLNLFLFDSNGTLLQYANTTTAKPERIHFEAQTPGRYIIGIKCKKGYTAYHLALDGELNDAHIAQYPAQPQPGTLFWGAAVTGNGDPSDRHEIPAETTLGIRRTFFKWHHRNSYMISTASSDLLAGRLPWVSIKAPVWQDMANGLHDAEIDEMLKALDDLAGPVWLTIHHEPEGGDGINHPDDPGGPSAHLAMNKQVRSRMSALGVENIALVPIFMSYTWNPKSGRNPYEWWEPGVYDLLGIDHYQSQESSLITPVWLDVRQWAAAQGVDIAVGEWGMRGTDEAAGLRVREWYDHAADSHEDGLGGRIVGLSVFDSGLNAPSGSWELQGAQLSTFHELMNNSRSATVELESDD